jgi:hypothetical protein
MLFNDYEPFSNMKGEERIVWCNEIATDGKHYAAHTKNFVQVEDIEKTKTMKMKKKNEEKKMIR